MSDIYSSPNCSLCRHHKSVISVNKDEADKVALALEQEFKQNASSSFQVVPAMESMDLLLDMDLAPAAGTQQTDQLAQNAKNWKESDSSSSVEASKVALAHHQHHDAENGHLLEKVSIVKCTSCDKSVALLVDGNFHSLHKLLEDKTKPEGWMQVESMRDRLVLFILNQIIYREYEVPDEDELEVEYAFPTTSEFTKILWNKGSAVGFYSVKPQGSLDQESMDWYRMTVLDTIFIKNSERRKGYASSAIKDILHEFPQQNIGFSVPISLPMIRVLKKHLQFHPEDRLKLWEVDGCGLEGNCQILWYLFQRR